MLRIVPPATSERIYPEIARQGLADRLTAFQQSVLSRHNLSAIVDRLRLYRDERARMPLEDVLEKMRRDIEIVAVAGGAPSARQPVFRVSFSYTNRLEVEGVTQTLVNGLIDESQRENSRRLDSVFQFVSSEHDRAALEVEAAEAKLAAFRRAGGKGPDQAGLRLHQMALLETRASAAEAGLSRARQEQALLEADVQVARAPRNLSPPAAGPAATPPPSSMVDHLEAERKRLRGRYTDSHPDVMRLTAEIDAARQAAAPGSHAPLAPRSAPPPSAAVSVPTVADPRTVRAEAQLRAKRLEIARFEQEITAVARQLAMLKTELDQAPDANATLDQLTREHEMALQRHRAARQKLLESEAARKGDHWKLGETLEVVDSPTLPETPVAPNRLAIVLLAALLGLGAGLAAVVACEWNDESLRTIRQLRVVAPARILGSIPLIENELVVRRRQRLAAVGWASAALMSAAVIGGSVLRYYAGRS